MVLLPSNQISVKKLSADFPSLHLQTLLRKVHMGDGHGAGGGQETVVRFLSVSEDTQDSCTATDFFLQLDSGL